MGRGRCLRRRAGAEEAVSERAAQGVELFLRFVELHGKAGEKQDLLYKAGLDATNFTDDYYAMIRCVMHLAFTPEQVDWIDWWLYERVEKAVTFADGTKRRLDTAEELWEFMHEGKVSRPTESSEGG
jgi:hypothetical protein